VRLKERLSANARRIRSFSTEDALSDAVPADAIGMEPEDPLFPFEDKNIPKEPVPGGIWYTSDPEYISEEEAPRKRKFTTVGMKMSKLEDLKKKMYERHWEEFKSRHERPLLQKFKQLQDARNSDYLEVPC
jgi:hypothetical protein